MKLRLLALCPVLLLTSCAGVRVTHTDIATGATNPIAIYIRPFDVSDCTFIGRNHSPGELAIRKSLAPAEFSIALKEELEKIAPAMILREQDIPETGWLVEGSLDLVDSGHPGTRWSPAGQCGDGASHIQIHVRVINLDARGVQAEGKDAGGVATQPVSTPHGAIIYEFDLAGGSNKTGLFGSVTAPGAGYAPMFDYCNAAERIYEALTPDEFRFGLRDGPTIGRQ